MEIYRNYDGNLSTFGDTSVSAAVANPDYLSSFAAVRSSDGALTVMVINKQQGSTPVDRQPGELRDHRHGASLPDRVGDADSHHATGQRRGRQQRDHGYASLAEHHAVRHSGGQHYVRADGPDRPGGDGGQRHGDANLERRRRSHQLYGQARHSQRRTLYESRLGTRHVAGHLYRHRA